MKSFAVKTILISVFGFLPVLAFTQNVDSLKHVLANVKQDTSKCSVELSATASSWKGELEQVDDITIIGVRVG
jgi:hypothetical protein